MGYDRGNNTTISMQGGKMSSTCMIVFNEINKYEDYDMMSKELVACALKNNKGVFFNIKGYADELISNAQITNYCVVSDSFVFYNSDFLSVPLDVNLKYGSAEQKMKFCLRYQFLVDYINVIFKYKNQVNLYVSDSGDEIVKDDFEIIICTKQNMLEILYNTILETDGYVFPALCLEIEKE